jgi:hypothetical protein
MRIALLVVLAFAGLWMVALRPKPGGDTAPPPQPAQGVTSAPAKAEAAVAKANGASAKAEKATAEPAAKPAAKPAAAPKTSSTAKPKAATGPAATPHSEGGPTVRNEAEKVKRVLADLKDGKVVVMLFWDRRSSEDREVFRAAEATDRHDGKVSVRAAPIQRLGAYDAVTKGLPIAASPSVVVIDRAKRATVISGLTVTQEIDAAVKRALKRK